MNYKIGDYVRFLNERQEGIITSIIDHQLVGVTIDGDFEITVLASEIVLVNSKENQITNEGSSDVNIVKPLLVNADRGIYVSFIQDEKAMNLYHLYIINNTDYDLLLSCFTEKNKSYQGVFSGKIIRRTFEKLASYNLNDFEKWPKHHFQFLYFRDGEFTAMQPLITTKEFKGKQFFQSETIAPLINKKGYYTQLDEMNIDTQKIIENLYSSTVSPVGIGLPPREVDLHIEELTEHFSGMSPQDMLHLQLETFRKNLEAAIVHHYPSIIFIHGVGNGTLRTEIHRMLSKHSNIKTFKDARKDKFGYGATEVILK